MMDPSVLIPWISPIIIAVVTYIKTQGTQKASDKAAEVIGEKATERAISIGQKALTLLRSKFSVKADTKAQQALANVEQDPNDEDYQQKLVKETARLASADPAFAQELKVLAETVNIAQSGSVAIDNKSSNYGAQGVFNAPLSFDQRTMRDTSHEHE
jgi:hypothetical protein